MKYRFEAFELDDQRGLLIGPGGDVSLRPQIFRLLTLLLEEAPAVVSQDRLIDEIWGTQHLCTTSLPRGICELRNVLGDEARKPRFIETVHRRGYRFVGDLEKVRDAGPPVGAGVGVGVEQESTEPLRDAVPLTTTLQTPALQTSTPLTLTAQTGLPASMGSAASRRRLWLLPTVLLLCGLATATWLLRPSGPAERAADELRVGLPLARRSSLPQDLNHGQNPLDALESRQWSELGLGAPTLGRDATVEPAVAIERLRAALSREPRSAALFWHLSRAWQEMGRLQEAREAAARALEHSAGLPWQARLMISALGDELEGDWYRAANRYRSLFESHPDPIGLALTYGRALREGGRPAQARQLVSDWLHGPMVDNPRLHLELADSCLMLEDFPCMLQAAERAAELTATGGSPWLHARALDAVGFARHRSGSSRPVDSVLSQAESMFQTYGFNSRSAQVSQHLAEVLADRGELDEARLLAETVIGVSRRLENRKELAWGFFLVGRLKAERGQLEEAQDLFERSIESFIAAGHLKGLADAKLALARLHRRRLRPEAALMLYEQSLEALAELKVESLEATVDRERIEVLESLGKFGKPAPNQALIRR